MKEARLLITLPDWVERFLRLQPKVFSTVEDRMRLVLALARQNIEHQTGGPFGAAIFDDHGCLIAPGINLVTATNCSVLHAEIVAIMLAQQRLGRYDIGGGKDRYELVASTEPCAMCFGAVPWSGVARLTCGARDEDARRIGFDEGPKLADWQQALAERGIAVLRDILHEEAVAVLDQYSGLGGIIYNPERQA